LDASLHPFTKEFAGWAILIIAGSNIAVNLALVGNSSVSDFRKSWLTSRELRARAKLRGRRLENFKTMTEDQPGRLPKLEHQLNEIKAVDYCKRWAVKRKWLRANKIDISDYEEEIKF
jgi:hypothetical protein